MSTSLDEFFTEHLPYEIDMMRFSMRMLLTQQLRRLEVNAYIETFCLHARNLIEFFKCKESCDFDPRDFTTAAFKLDTRFIGDSALPKITRQVSHLTKGRTKDATQKINVGEMTSMLAAIEGEIDRFTQHLKPECGPLRCELSRLPNQGISGTVTAMTSTASTVTHTFPLTPKTRQGP